MFQRGLYAGLGMGASVFFDRETFGADRLLRAPAESDSWSTFLAQAPLSDAARRDIGRLVKDRADHLAGLDDGAKKARLARTSYADFLVKTAGCHPDVLSFFQGNRYLLQDLVAHVMERVPQLLVLVPKATLFKLLIGMP